MTDTPQWAVRLRNKHTGQVITLSTRYTTQAKAEVASKKECGRCNSISVVAVWPGSVLDDLLSNYGTGQQRTNRQ